MIKQKKKLCNNCNTEQFIWKNDKGSRYCKYCWYKSKESKVNKLIRKPINQKSKKRLVLDRSCHNWIHNFPVEARELDLLK